MSKDLKVDGLEAANVEQPVDDKKAAKKAETQKMVEKAAEFLVNEIGVSDELAKMVELAKHWDADKDEKQAAKEETIEAFGGSDKIKAYATEKMAEELEVYRGIDKLVSRLNTIRHFYAKRKSSGSRGKAATTKVRIGNDYYTVSAAYLQEIADKPREEKRELILAHPMTVKDAITEL